MKLFGALVLATLTLTTAASAASAPEAPVVVARLNTLTRVAAYGSTIAYSTRLGNERMALSIITAGHAETVKVPTRLRLPFDVDLGRRPGGGVVAVYSRCEDELGYWFIVTDYYRGTDCRLYSYDIRRQVETPVDAGTPAGGSDVGPQLWGNRLIFLRYAPAPDGVHSTQALMLLDLADGQLSTIWEPGPTQRVTGADLRGRSIALATFGSIAGDPIYTRSSSVYRLTLGAGAPTQIAYRRSSDPPYSAYFSPQLTASGVIYGDGSDRAEGQVLRWRTASGTRAKLPLPQAIAWLATTDRYIYTTAASTATGETACLSGTCPLIRRPLPRSLRPGQH